MPYMIAVSLEMSDEPQIFLLFISVEASDTVFGPHPGMTCTVADCHAVDLIRESFTYVNPLKYILFVT